MGLIIRHCFRCSRELTDAASLEAGIGPICRQLDNAILATTFPVEPANLALARDKVVEALALAAMQGDTLAPMIPAECIPTVQAILDATANVEANGDYRKVVKRVEWVLSFQLNWQVKNPLVALVSALGYKALVGLWSGKTATGKVTVSVTTAESGAVDLIVSGPRNRFAGIALSKSGAKFHYADKAWHLFDARPKALGFWAEAVQIYYPNHDRGAMMLALAAAEERACFLVEQDEIQAAKVTVGQALIAAFTVLHVQASLEALDAADKAKAKASAQAAALEASKPFVAPPVTVMAMPAGCDVKVCDGVCKVKSPYRPAFIGAIKEIVGRKWNKTEQVWEVPAAALAQVVSLVQKHYA